MTPPMDSADSAKTIQTPSGLAPSRLRFPASVDADSCNPPTEFRKRSRSLDAGNWLQLFVRRSSADFSIADTLSPSESLESISSCSEDQPRSRHSSGDATIQLTNQSPPGLIDANVEQGQLYRERRKSDATSWNWKLFNARIRKISELDEVDADVSKTIMSDLSASGTGSGQSSSKLLKMATKISGRDLNALSPSGDI